MKKQKNHKFLKGTLGLTAAAGVVYFGVGGLIYSQMLSRRAAVRGLNRLPAGDIVAGKIGASGEAVLKPDFFEKLFGGDAGIEAAFALPGFHFYQEGIQWYMEKNPEKVVTESPLGGNIHADVIKQENPSNVWVISIHGYTACARIMGYTAKEFYGWGYNLLFPHLRAHGDSESSDISMGWLDRLDIIAWINYLNREYDNPQIILHGESMGGATVMMTTGENLPDNVVCAIEDCGYTSAWDMFALQAKEMFHLPVFMATSLDVLMRLRQGFSLKEATCVEQVKKSKTPTLFIHGEADPGVPFHMLNTVYEAAACEKEKFTVAEAGHGESKYLEPELYFSTVKNFIDRYLK